jgi:CoA:oxalate CoA-transferase
MPGFDGPAILRGMTSPTDAAAPLAGFRILDLTTFLSGPLATRSLAVLGAEVVKIEPPTGDPTRAGSGLHPGDAPSPFWLALHRDRSSVVLDLKNESGRAVLLELVGHADALVENFRPGVMARLGLEPDVLRQRNPRLVSCAISGFGGDGPFSQLAAIDGPVQAFTGMLELTGSDGEAGLPIPMQVADIAGASYAAQAVLAALLARERSGHGAHIELSLAECVMQWLGVVDRSGTLAPPSTLILETSDARSVLVQAIMHFHPRLAELVAKVPGNEGFATDARFADRESRARHREAYEDAVRCAFRTRTQADWLADLHAAGCRRRLSCVRARCSSIPRWCIAAPQSMQRSPDRAPRHCLRPRSCSMACGECTRHCLRRLVNTTPPCSLPGWATAPHNSMRPPRRGHSVTSDRDRSSPQVRRQL